METRPRGNLSRLTSLFQKAFGLDCTNDVQLLKGYTICLWLIDKAKEESKSIHEIASSRPFILSADAANNLCQWMVASSYDHNYFSFFDLFSPFIIADQTKFKSYFSASFKPHRITRITEVAVDFCEGSNRPPFPLSPEDRNKLYTVLRDKARTTISTEKLESFWLSLHGTPLYQSDIKIRGTLNSAMRLYKRYNVPYRKLLDDYSVIVLQNQEKLETAINTWAYVNSVLGREREQGLSVEETLFEEAAYKLKNELPTDVIRALFYGNNRNDSAFECSFLLDQFIKLIDGHRPSTDILVVNPSPDFLLAITARIKAPTQSVCFAVRDKVTASLYIKQFGNRFRFIPFSEIPSMTNIERLLIMTRDSVDEELSQLLKSLEICSPDARILALLPSIMYDSGRNDFKRILFANHLAIDRALIVATSATKSTPRKKTLFYLSPISKHSNSNEQQTFNFPTYNSFCTDDNHFCVARDHIDLAPEAFYTHAEPLLTLYNRKLKNKQNPEVTHKRARRNPPKEYHFSPEITIWYTLSENRKARFAAKAYYCETISSDSRRRGSIITPILERGLRAKSRESVIHALENVAFEPEFTPVIVKDIRDNLKTPPSLKTIWFCLRQRLLTTPRYNDTRAREMFCCDCQALANLNPVEAVDTDYQKAMDELKLSDSSSIMLQYWLQLELIITTAVKEQFIRTNPLYYLMQQLSSRATEEEREVRNALVKKTFTYTEEKKMLDFIRSPHGGNLPRYITHSKWLAGAIRLFTGMSASEVRMLSWKDYHPIDELEAYQFLVFPMQDEIALPDKTRLVPVASLLSQMLNARLDYLLRTYSSGFRSIKDYPIVCSREINEKSLPEPETLRCSARQLATFSQEFIKRADIPEHFLALPKNDDSEFRETNIAKYEGDIFRANFRYHANHSCGMTRGEVSYSLGNTPPDTFSRYYCDYTNDLIQYGMIRKLDRWTSRFETASAPPLSFSQMSWHGGKNDPLVAPSSGAGTVREIYSTIVVNSDNSPDDFFELEISSRGGVSGSISVIFSDGGDNSW